uniref:Potassium/proton antiporter CemA n=1 Tax=Ourococcus multisporus TaxID=132186 RepID=A0A140GJ23_9CHLO|nr:chloroplast envelope membrane protein [Ourococcus multisporus]
MFSNKTPNQSSLFFTRFKEKISTFFNLKSSEYLTTQISNSNNQVNTNGVDEFSNSVSFKTPASTNNSFSNLISQNNFKKNMSNNFNQTKSYTKISATKPLASKMLGSRYSRLPENTKQQVVSITYEEIGLFPRSFNRVFDRFFKQLFFDVENLVIQEYRFYRYLFLTTVKCMFILLFVPLAINFIAKNYLVRPITEYYWNTHQPEIFLNSYQQKRAFTELQDFEEKIYFESLILPNPNQSNVNVYTKKPMLNSMENPKEVSSLLPQDSQLEHSYEISKLNLTNSLENRTIKSLVNKTSDKFVVNNESNILGSGFTNYLSVVDVPSYSIQTPVQIPSLKLQSPYTTELFSESVQNRLHEKILELAIYYNEESIEAITNFFADLISFSCLCYLFFVLEIQINITKSFLLEVFFGLDDSKKSLFILFLTDLLVGYHSPNIWELFFSSLFDHYGLPESQTTIFLLVATLPVLLDVLFKYLIFRHLNRASPATVATYHAMIE